MTDESRPVPLEAFHEVVETPEAEVEAAVEVESKPEPPKLPPGYREAGAMAATFESPALPAFGRLTFKEPRWEAFTAVQEAVAAGEPSPRCLALFIRACLKHSTTGALRADMPLAEISEILAKLTLTQGNALAAAVRAFDAQLLRAKVASGNG